MGIVAVAREQYLETVRWHVPPTLAVAVLSKLVRVHEIDRLYYQYFGHFLSERAEQTKSRTG
jgi:hypothetical protein